jgi:uncharacterized RDD family membrane protein YckC
MSEVGWYYDNAGQQVGPVEQAALVELIRSGRIAPGTRVWRPGLAGWAAWETVLDVSSQVAPPPAGPPPLGTPPAGPPGLGAPPFSGNSYAADVLTGAGAGALYPKAPLGGRFLAALVDHLISTVPASLLVVAAVSAFLGDATAVGVVVGLLALVAVVWALFYSFTKDGRPGGQSIGKKMMGLMVVHLPSNQPCNMSQSALRNLVMFLLGLVPYVGWLIEPIVLLAAAGGRRLGDTAAGTQVILATDYKRRS